MVNQSRKYIRENAVRITRIEAHEEVVRTFMQELHKKLKSWEVRLGAAEIQIEMDRVLSSLEVLYDEYLKQVDYYRTHKTALEEGRLTENLLPPHELQGILRLATQQGYQCVETVEWYYEHIKVEPVWRNGENLLYRLAIPLLDPKRYLIYEIQAFPFPLTNTSYSVAIETNSIYGLDTITGGLFIPQCCLGRDPVVCQTGPIYDDEQLQCPRGLILGQSKLTRACTVRISTGVTTSLITQIDVNSYVLSTWGENIILRCPGKNEQIIPLSLGVCNITCPPDCTISGKHWTANGVKEFHLKKHITMKSITVDRNIKVLASIQPGNILKMYPGLHTGEVSTINNVNPALLTQDLDPKVDWKGNGSLLFWFILLLLLSIFVIVTVVYLYKKRSEKLLRCIRHSPQEIPPQPYTMLLLPVQLPNHDNDPVEET